MPKLSVQAFSRYNKAMRIAMIGQKTMVLGERAGGIEKHVAEISTRLVDYGHDVTVYARVRYTPKRPDKISNVKLKFLPTIYKKHLEAITHTFFASVHALFQKYDIIHYHGVGPATMAWIPRIFAPRTTVIVTFHAQDQFHTKWGWFARRYLALGERAAVMIPHYCITVSHVLQIYCRKNFNRQVVYIPNGAEIKNVISSKELDKFGLDPKGYVLNVGRIVGQKGLHYLVEAFKQVETKKQLVFVGSASFTEIYFKNLRELARGDNRIHFLGYQTGKTLDQLYANAYLFCSPSESEGLPLVVLEAMGFGLAPLVSDIPENLEAIHHTGFTFHNADVEDLRQKLQELVNHPELVGERSEESRAVIETQFNWDRITQQIEGVYISSRH
ncbi:MAG: glycosyltransferase family 4 protein [Patescibacteria group bacterium]